MLDQCVSCEEWTYVDEFHPSLLCPKCERRQEIYEDIITDETDREAPLSFVKDEYDLVLEAVLSATKLDAQGAISWIAKHVEIIENEVE